MAMNGWRRFTEVSAEAVVRSLIDDEIHYLTEPEAGPDEVGLLQETVPQFNPSYLRRTLGKAVLVRFRKGNNIKKYVMPEVNEVFRLVRAERDDVIASHIGTADGRDHEAHIKACNRVMEMLRVKRSTLKK